MEKTLRVRYSTFETPLTYNEWCQRYGISTKWDDSNEQNRELIYKIELAKFIRNNPNIYGTTETNTEDKRSLKKEMVDIVSHIREYFIEVLN